MNGKERGVFNYLKAVCNIKFKRCTIEAVDVKTILNLIEKQQKEIEELNKENTRQQELIDNIHQKWKDKIRKKINLIDKEYAETIEKNKNDLFLVNINAQRHSAMQLILEELLGE